MKKQFLKIAGVKTEDEFYNKYPSEEDFFKAHPEALKQLARGGEAFPQIATMDNFFSYGVPVPLTIHAYGGPVYPQIQTEAQFFSPVYSNSKNAYDRGGPVKKRKRQKAEDKAANANYRDMTEGLDFDQYDRMGSILPYDANRSNYLGFQNEAKPFYHNQGVWDAGLYANMINERLGRQAVMGLQKPFTGPYDLVGRTQSWENLPDQMDISEPYIDSSIDYRTLTPSNPKDYLSGGPEIMGRGGSYIEEYSQAKKYPKGPVGGSAFYMMQDGGYMPEEEPLPRMGVKGYLTDFIGAVKNTAAKKINDNLALHGAVKNPEQYDFEQARYGGNLKSYQSQNTQGNTPDPNSDKGTTNPTSSTNPSGSSVVNNYYYGLQDPYNRNYNSNPYANTRVRGSFGRYNQPLYTDKKAMDALGVSHFNINTPKTALGRFFRPTTIDYYRDVPGGQGNQQGMPTGQGAGQGAGQEDPTKGMGFLARMAYRKGNMVGQAPGVTNVSNTNRKPFQLESNFDPTGYNANRSEGVNQVMQNIHRQQGRKMDELHSKDYNLKREGITGGLGKRDERKLARLERRNKFFEDKVLNVDDPSVSNFQRYSKPDIHVQDQSAGSLAPMNSNPSSAGPRNDVDFNTPDFQSAYPPGAAQTGWQKGSSYVPSQSSSNTSSPQGYQQMQNVMNAVSAGAIAPGTYTDPNVIAAQNAASNAAAGDSGFPPELLRRQAGPTNYRKGGSYNAGDVVDMTPEEIQRFIEMGGQVEFLD